MRNLLAFIKTFIVLAGTILESVFVIKKTIHCLMNTGDWFDLLIHISVLALLIMFTFLFGLRLTKVYLEHVYNGN